MEPDEDKYSETLTAIGGRKVALTLLGIILAVVWGLAWHYLELADAIGEAVLYAIVGLVTAYVTGNAITRVARARVPAPRSSTAPGPTRAAPTSPDPDFP